MTVRLEVAADQVELISDFTARDIIEKVMSLCEQMGDMEDDEVVEDLEEVRDLLEKHGLVSN